MWQEFFTAFSPFFEDFFSAVNDIISIFLNPASDPTTGLPLGLSIFGVPIFAFFIFGFLSVMILRIIFKGK